MQNGMSIQKSIEARSAGLRKLHQLTAGVAVSAFAGAGLIAAWVALSVPGTSSSVALTTCATTSPTLTRTTSDETNSDDSISSSTTGQLSPCTVSSSTGTAVAVSGGSHPH
jgi:hypothetical protein